VKPVQASLLRGAVDTAELLGELEGAFGFGPVGEEAAWLPAHPPFQRRQAHWVKAAFRASRWMPSRRAAAAT
jgi:hypothetical protein